jgi:hypothetical protein
MPGKGETRHVLKAKRIIENLRGLYYLPGLDAPCANFDPTRRTRREDDTDLLKIRIKAAPRFIVSV